MFRKRSSMWNHFTTIPDCKKAKCTYCSKTVSYSGGSISNLRRHLEKKHRGLDFSGSATTEQVPISADLIFEVEEAQTFKNESVAPNITNEIVILPQQESSITTVTQQYISHTTASHFQPVSSNQQTGIDNLPENERKTQVRPCRTKVTDMSRRRSSVWKHFWNCPGNKRAKCSYCLHTVSFASRSISNLRRHLDRKHPELEFCRTAAAEKSAEDQAFEFEVETIDDCGDISNESATSLLEESNNISILRDTTSSDSPNKQCSIVTLVDNNSLLRRQKLSQPIEEPPPPEEPKDTILKVKILRDTISPVDALEAGVPVLLMIWKDGGKNCRRRSQSCENLEDFLLGKVLM